MRLKSPLATTLILFIILIGIFSVVRYQKMPGDKPIDQSLSLPSKTAAITREESEIHSSDGTMKLIMKAEKKDQVKSYSFFIADISGKNERLLFTKIVEPEKKMSVPQNSFSPDNKYVYLEESEGDSLNALVFKASGEPFTNNLEYLDVAALLSTSKPEYRLTHVTGWASPQFLQMKLVKGDSTKSLSYWFDVYSRAFLQLASH